MADLSPGGRLPLLFFGMLSLLGGVLAGLARNAPLTRPRPGHADLAGMQKYGFDEARPVLERASARETAARVAAAGIAREGIGTDTSPNVARVDASVR